MDQTDRIIGALQEFKLNVERRLDVIEKKVDALQQFRWRVAGGTMVIVGIVEVLSRNLT